jgi:hypothetical protein
MALESDGDPVRGLGFVALNAAYLEEQIENLLFMLQPVEGAPQVEQRWPVSRKIEKAERLVTGLRYGYRDELLRDLDTSRDLFELRNEVIHGRIYGDFDRPDTLRSGRPDVPDRLMDAAERYHLANNLAQARAAVYRPMIFQIPRAIQAHE